ncbi:MAG: ankyrin repeat domain-containing protein [Fibrobacterales bacterium]
MSLHTLYIVLLIALLPITGFASQIQSWGKTTSLDTLTKIKYTTEIQISDTLKYRIRTCPTGICFDIADENRFEILDNYIFSEYATVGIPTPLKKYVKHRHNYDNRDFYKTDNDYSYREMLHAELIKTPDNRAFAALLYPFDDSQGVLKVFALDSVSMQLNTTAYWHEITTPFFLAQNSSSISQFIVNNKLYISYTTAKLNLPLSHMSDSLTMNDFLTDKQKTFWNSYENKQVFYLYDAPQWKRVAPPFHVAENQIPTLYTTDSTLIISTMTESGTEQFYKYPLNQIAEETTIQNKKFTGPWVLPPSITDQGFSGVTELYFNHIDLNSKHPQSGSLLQQAIHFSYEFGEGCAGGTTFGAPKAVEALLDLGVNTAHQFFYTAAFNNHNPETISALINHDVAINEIDSTGTTPLMKALKARNTSIVQQLIEAGADVTLKDTAGLHTHFYIEDSLSLKHFEDNKLLKHLLPADLALIFSNAGNTTDLRELLNAGVSVTTEDIHGNQLIHRAANGDHAATLKLLLTSGATVDQPNSKGITALHIADSLHNISILKPLSEFKAIGRSKVCGDLFVHFQNVQSWEGSEGDSGDITVMKTIIQNCDSLYIQRPHILNEKYSAWKYYPDSILEQKYENMLVADSTVDFSNFGDGFLKKRFNSDTYNDELQSLNFDKPLAIIEAYHEKGFYTDSSHIYFHEFIENLIGPGELAYNKEWVNEITCDAYDFKNKLKKELESRVMDILMVWRETKIISLSDISDICGLDSIPSDFNNLDSIDDLTEGEMDQSYMYDFTCADSTLYHEVTTRYFDWAFKNNHPHGTPPLVSGQNVRLST